MKSFDYLLAGALFGALTVHANCGLDHCPRLSPGETPANNSASFRISNTAFDLDSGSGEYEELLARYEYTGISHWMFAGSLPVIALTARAETHYGISNPLLYASWYSRFNKTGMIYVGTQLELPFGNADGGMASDHLMLVPYAQMEDSFGAGFAFGSIGYSQAFALHEHEGGKEHPLYVNPHEDREFLCRVGTGLRVWNDKFTPQISISGQHAMVDELEGPGRDHVVAGIAVACNLRHNLKLTPSFELPITSPKRFEWNAGLEIKGLF